MEIREVGCDREGCTRRNAETYTVFSHRKQDGAGSMEDWYHTFDLCSVCARDLLLALLHKTAPAIAKEIVDAQGTKTRLT